MAIHVFRNSAVKSNYRRFLVNHLHPALHFQCEDIRAFVSLSSFIKSIYSSSTSKSGAYDPTSGYIIQLCLEDAAASGFGFDLAFADLALLALPFSELPKSGALPANDEPVLDGLIPSIWPLLGTTEGTPRIAVGSSGGRHLSSKTQKTGIMPVAWCADSDESSVGVYCDGFSRRLFLLYGAVVGQFKV
uniref:Uncharacterized protein n=1 Tax=Glossina palpalis gambiensis TaxID=67801 RepID=A0A1B0BXJ6_9MUSC